MYKVLIFKIADIFGITKRHKLELRRFLHMQLAAAGEQLGRKGPEGPGIQAEYEPAMCSWRRWSAASSAALGNASPAWRHRHTGVRPVKGHKDD